MATDIKLTDNSIILEGSEVQNTGPTAGYAFRDRAKPNQQRWVLYANGGPAKLYADSRGGDIVTFDQGGDVRTTGPTAGFTCADRAKPAEVFGTWFCNDGIALEFTGPLANGKITERLLFKADNIRGVTIFNHASVTGNFKAQGDVNFQGNLDVGGKLTQTSSIAVKDDVAELSGAEAMAALDELNPVTFRYKADAQRALNVGFIAEDVPTLLTNADRDRLSAMDIVAVLTKVVKEQQQKMAELAAQIDTLKQQNADTDDIKLPNRVSR